MQVNKVFNPIVYVFGLDKIDFLKVWEMCTFHLLHMLQLLPAFAQRPLDKIFQTLCKYVKLTIERAYRVIKVDRPKSVLPVYIPTVS